MAERKIAVVGFPKCGTMSLALWSKQIYPGAQITRSENIYLNNGNWHDYTCMAITRNPVDRIKSCIQYWPQISKLYYEKGMDEVLKGLAVYDGVGFSDPIGQSDYNRYIHLFEEKHDVKVEVYKFEDMIKKPEFPHINESNTKINLTIQDREIINKRLHLQGVSY